MDWDKLRTFYTVAKIGTFTGAGAFLSLSQSATSRQISSLEKSLGLMLFNRHARGLILTEQGEILYQTVQEVFTKLTLTETTLKENKNTPTGSLTIATIPSFAAIWLAPRIPKFIEKYPEIHLQIRVDDIDLDLRMREADVAIRMHETIQADLVQRHLYSFSLNAYASKKYISKYGHPKVINDLRFHKIIAYGINPILPFQKINWVSQLYEKNEKKKLPDYLSFNSLLGVLRLIKTGVGIGTLPSYATVHETGLIPVLDDIKPPTLSAFYVYPVELRSSKKVRAFRDFLMEELIRDSQTPI